jgi:hypothetical protein
MSKKQKEAKAALEKATAALVCAPASPTKTANRAKSTETVPRPRHDSIEECGASAYRIKKIKAARKANANSMFLTLLHPHIRNRIYAYVMEDDTHADLEPAGLQRPPHLKEGYSNPAIMQVCSSIRLEASVVRYSQTTFIYRQEKVLFKWLRLIGHTNRTFVRTVRRDHIFCSRAWAEAAIVFTHARLRDNCIEGLAKDAVEVAFWEKAVHGTDGDLNDGSWTLIRGEKWDVGGKVVEEA